MLKLCELSMSSKYIVTESSQTDCTQFTEKVSVEKSSNLSKVFLNRFQKKWFQNKDQLDYVVDYLVLDKGFVLDKQRNGVIVFNHPNKESTYHLDTNEMTGQFVEKRLLGSFE